MVSEFQTPNQERMAVAPLLFAVQIIQKLSCAFVLHVLEIRLASSKHACTDCVKHRFPTISS